MIPVLLSLLVSLIVVGYFYARIHVKEKHRHLEAERDAEREHARDWRTLAVNLTERGLLIREIPLLKEDLNELTKPAEPEPTYSDMSLEELRDEYEQIENPISVASTGELGKRRDLARQIFLKQRDADLRDKSDLATEDYVADFTDADRQFLSGGAS